MAAGPSLLGHGDNAVLRSGNGAADEQEVPLGVYAYHPKPDLGMTLGAHVARHPLPLDHSGRIGPGADRAWLPVASVAVSRRTAAEPMTMHHALEPTALGRAGDLHQLAGGEDVHLDLGTCSGCLTVDLEAPKHLRCRLEAGFLRVTQLSLGRALRATGAESKLHPALLHLDDATGSRLDHGHRHRRAVLFEDSGHAELAADQSNAHGYSTLISTSTPAGRSSFVSASIVCGRESLMSMRRLWVRSSNCSRLFLSTWGLRSTVHRSVLTGSGMGPDT